VIASPLRSLPSSRRRAVAAAGAVLLATSLAASLAACNGGGSGSGRTTSSGGSAARSGSGGDAAAPVPGPANPLDESAKSAGATDGTGSEPSGTGDGGTRNGSANGSANGTANAARVLPTDRDVVYRGSISVQVTDVGRAVDRAEALALGTDGLVGNEQTQTDPRHPRYGQASLTLRVPPSAFGPTLDALGRLGKELDRQRSAQDVTTQVIDVDSRVRSQQRSVERMRTLLSRAKTIGEVVQVESELSQREADLESLEAQLKGLKDVTGLATIQVTFASPDLTPAKPRQKHDQNLGFLSGLGGGWDAFVGVTLVVLTVLGALVPFVVAGALIGVPALLVWRSRRRLPAA
jgi:uncharacterized protein DUF4349